MKQLSLFKYEVSKGEIVTIIATPHGSNGLVTAKGSDTTVVQGSDTPPTFTFEATKSVGKRHRIFIQADFTADDAEEATVVLTFSGNKGGGAFVGDALDRPDADDPDQFDRSGFQFKVVD